MFNEDLGISIKLAEYLLYNKINIIYFEGYQNIKDFLKQYVPGLIFSRNGLEIHIRNKTTEKGLIINYLSSIKKIYAKYAILIPWSNIENPLIMYEYKKKYKLSKNSILSNLDYVSYQEYNKYYELQFKNPVTFDLVPTMILKEPIEISSPPGVPPMLPENQISDVEIKKILGGINNKIRILNEFLEIK